MIAWLRARPRWIPYLLVSAVHLVLLAAHSPWHQWTHIALMPALVWPALTVRRPLTWWVLVALGLSWLGDTLPRFVHEPNSFLFMAGFFLLAQLTWVTALGNRWSLTVPASRPATSALYIVAAIAIAGITVPFAGSLGPIVVLYALALTAAAILASSLGDRGTWGGALFMVSDGLIAFDSFIKGFHFDGLDVLIMFTYVMAQGLLVSGASRLRNPAVPTPGDAQG